MRSGELERTEHSVQRYGRQRIVHRLEVGTVQGVLEGRHAWVLNVFLLNERGTDEVARSAHERTEPGKLRVRRRPRDDWGMDVDAEDRLEKRERHIVPRVDRNSGEIDADEADGVQVEEVATELQWNEDDPRLVICGLVDLDRQVLHPFAEHRVPDQCLGEAGDLLFGLDLEVGEEVPANSGNPGSTHQRTCEQRRTVEKFSDVVDDPLP